MEKAKLTSADGHGGGNPLEKEGDLLRKTVSSR